MNCQYPPALILKKTPCRRKGKRVYEGEHLCTQHYTIRRNILSDARQHEAQCSWCNLDDLERVERRFLNWQLGATELVNQYGLSRDSWYRHVAHFDLLRKRNDNVESFLGQVMERGRSAPVKGGDALRAAGLLVRSRKASAGDVNKIVAAVEERIFDLVLEALLSAGAGSQLVADVGEFLDRRYDSSETRLLASGE